MLSKSHLMATPAHITLVDDDESVREALPDLLREEGFEVETHASAEAFLAAGAAGVTDCLILDVAMPGMSGPDLKLELDGRGETVPVIFITARRDESVRTRLIGLGAVAVLFKPFSDTALFAAIGDALRNR